MFRVIGFVSGLLLMAAIGHMQWPNANMTDIIVALSSCSAIGFSFGYVVDILSDVS